MNWPGRKLRRVVGVAVTLAVSAPTLAFGQYAVISPAGDSVNFELAELRAMLETARVLYADLEEDPRVLYILGFGPPVHEDAPRAAYPWNAVLPQSDSTVAVTTPGNLREADRAYHNYSVMLMREVRSQDPDDPCDALVEREEKIVSSFVDGWVLARTLFGGPAYAPLDEFAFARRAGHLRALLAFQGDTSVGACAAVWVEEHPTEVEAYREWRETKFPGLTDAPTDSSAADPAVDDQADPVDDAASDLAADSAAVEG